MRLGGLHALPKLLSIGANNMEPNEYILMSKQQDTHWWFRARRKIIQTSIERFIPSASGSSNASLRILEIGSGMGGNFELLAKFGDVYALSLIHI